MQTGSKWENSFLDDKAITYFQAKTKVENLKFAENKK